MKAWICAALLVCLSATTAQACAISREQEDAGFARADADGNKRLSPEEYFMSYVNPAPRDMWDRIFNSLDKNKDSALTRNEYDIRAGNAFPTNRMAAPQSVSTGCAGLK